MATNESRMALFLDFENLVTNTGITASNFDLQPAMDRLLERGKVVYRRAYCNWSRFEEAKGKLHALGVELLDVPPSTRSGKNAADMRLVIDALELCYAREHIDTFIIASGDSDFCPLAYKLRENDRTVIGLAVREATSPLFVKACDAFIYLKAPSRKIDAEKPQERGEKKGEDPKGRRKEGTERKGGRSRVQPEIPPLARELVNDLLNRATGPINPSLIKETLVRKKPDFDEREYGFSSFSKMLEAMEREGLLKRQHEGRQWYVLPPDAAPDAPESGDEGADA